VKSEKIIDGCYIGVIAILIAETTKRKVKIEINSGWSNAIRILIVGQFGFFYSVFQCLSGKI